MTALFSAGDPEVLYVVDLSSYLLRAYHAIAELKNSKGEPTNATYGTVTMLERLVRERRPQLMAIAMNSGRDTFRREIYAEYKATRPPAPDDLKHQMHRAGQIVEAFAIPVFSAKRGGGRRPHRNCRASSAGQEAPRRDSRSRQGLDAARGKQRPHVGHDA